MLKPQSFEYSIITPYLYISSRPKNSSDVNNIERLGIDLVISLLTYGNYKGMASANFKYINYPTIDSFLTPIPMVVFKKGVKQAVKTINQNGKVLVHCKHGVHRSVAMACCILISQGYSFTKASDLIIEKRPTADPYAWYIKSRIKKFERYWNK